MADCILHNRKPRGMKYPYLSPCGTKYRKYTEEQIFEAGKKYKTRGEFRKHDRPLYTASRMYGIHERVCEHMDPPANNFHMYVYKLTNDFNQIYFGITCKLKQRERQHNKKPKLLQPFKMDAISGPLTVKEAAQMESELIANAHQDLFMDCVNVTKGGETGGRTSKWDEEAVADEASKYLTVSDFMKSANAAYKQSIALGIREKVCAHMTRKINPRGYYSKNQDRIREAAAKCKTRKEFETNHSAAYQAARALGIYEEVCSHMESPIKKRTAKEVIAECKQYPTCKILVDSDPALHGAAGRIGVWKEASAHMIPHREYLRRQSDIGTVLGPQ